jgi:hypothetical protein
MIRPIVKMAAFAVACLALAIPAYAQQSGSITWSGDVDQGATVFIHSHHVWVDNVIGKAVNNINMQIDADLPHDYAANVRLDDVRGRGSVELIRQPTADNNYTAAVRIRDPEPGRGQYHFRLEW